MKTVNQSPFAVQAMPLALPGRGPVLTVIVKGTFDIRQSGEVAAAEHQIPVAFGDEYFDGKKGGSVKLESDIVPFKPRTDIVLIGKAHAPGGRPAPVVDAGIRVGRTSKTLKIFGDRKWVCDGKKLTGSMTAPVPFVTMDLVPERAFGGMDEKTGGICVENPRGRGYFDQEIVDSPGKAFLPNIEDPGHLIRHWKDHPPPAGFGVVGKGDPARRKYLGTFDEKWRKERCPELPADFLPEYFNCAQPDLQVAGYLEGSETVRLVNLTPEGNKTFRLPGAYPVVSIGKTDVRGGSCWNEDVTMNLDTICLNLEEGKIALAWRGICSIEDMASLEVQSVSVVMKGFS